MSDDTATVMIDAVKEIIRLRAEIERLTRERDLKSHMLKTTQKKYDEYFERANDAERRVEKLRELLRDARGYVSAYRDSDHHVARAMLARIDAALTETEKG